MVYELYWGVYNTRTNEWVPLTSCQLSFGMDHTSEIVDPIYFNRVMPWAYHSANMNKHIYMYTFSLFPNEKQPSGACNLSVIPSKTLKIKIDPFYQTDLQNCQLHVFANNYNLLQIQNGTINAYF